MAPAKFADFARAPKDFFSAGWYDDKDVYQFKLTKKTAFQGVSVTSSLGNSAQKMTFKWPKPYDMPVNIDKAEFTLAGGAAKLVKVDLGLTEDLLRCPGLKLKVKGTSKTNYQQPVVDMDYTHFADANLNGSFDVGTKAWNAGLAFQVSSVVLGAEVTSAAPTSPNLGLQFKHSGLLAAAYLTGLNPQKFEVYAKYAVTPAIEAAGKYVHSKESCAAGVGYKISPETEVKASLHRDGAAQSARFNIAHLVAAKFKVAVGGSFDVKYSKPTFDFAVQLD